MRLRSKSCLCLWVLSLAACSTPAPMPNQLIIQEVRYCESQGFRGVPIINAYSGMTIAVQCLPADKGGSIFK